MEVNDFYLTITSDDDKYDAHKLKEQLKLSSIQAWNKSELVEGLPILRFKKMCLYFAPSQDVAGLDFILSNPAISKLLTLPRELTKMLNFVSNSSTERQSHGCYLNVDKVKNIAVLNASFKFYAKLHFLSLQHQFPCTEYIEPFDLNKENSLEMRAIFSVNSFTHTVAEISEQLGFKHNHNSYNFDDIRRNSNRPYGFTSFQYSLPLNKKSSITEDFDNFINDLYLHKNNILALGNEIAVSYGLSITGYAPDEYEFEVSAQAIHKLAQMQISLDIDMYFYNNY